MIGKAVLVSHSDYCSIQKEIVFFTDQERYSGLLDRVNNHNLQSIQGVRMLVLSRREGEKIIIGDSITVTIVRASGDKVRVGIDAPDDILVLRGELEVHHDGRRVHKPANSVQQGVSKPAA